MACGSANAADNGPRFGGPACARGVRHSGGAAGKNRTLKTGYGRIMKKLNAIISKEWKSFIGSDRGVFAVYAILILSWSFLPLYKGFSMGMEDVWWLFFSVVISGNFSNTVFVSERLSGSMEILLTSGFPRDTVLFGKAAFITGISIAIGTLCLCLSRLWLHLAGGQNGFRSRRSLRGRALLRRYVHERGNHGMDVGEASESAPYSHCNDSCHEPDRRGVLRPGIFY